MNITFLIGNGFDLNLDLQTQYESFLKKYTATEDPDNQLLTNFKKQILEEADLWSNAEMAFGNYTQKMVGNNNNAEDFCICHEDFCEKLANYLDEQEAQIDFSALKAEIGASFAQSIAFQNIIKGFREESRTQLKDAASNFSDGYNYNFISFNYTKTLDKCIDCIRSRPALLGRRTHRNVAYDNSIGKLYHVHGYTDSDMVLGVNDESQISVPELFDGFGPEYKNQLIKQQTNKMNEQGIDKKVHSLIRNSDLLYIYGMSIGETDALWWKRIASAMKNSGNLHLIIHCYAAPPEGLIRRKYQTFSTVQKEHFLSFSDLPSNEKTMLMDRIHIDNSNIFALLRDTVTQRLISDEELQQMSDEELRALAKL